MKIYDYLNMSSLFYALNGGLVTQRNHPRWPLAILNYTTKAMGKTHDNDTLRKCRGLIYDVETFEIVARPIQAFFNVNDERYPETSIERLQTLFHSAVSHHDVCLEITEKMDGSMGIIYQYKDNPPEVATRGSFTSEQAVWATLFVQSYDYVKPPLYTPIVEIIYPGNQIVVDYGDRKALVLIAMIETETGAELTHRAQPFRLPPAPLTVVPLYNKSPAQCALENFRNREGYVFKFFVHDKTIPLRFKAKFEDYRLAHRAMFGMNTRDVWELMKAGTLDWSVFDSATDGFKKWLRDQVTTLQDEFEHCKQLVEMLVDDVQHVGIDRDTTRKEVAEFLKSRAGNLFSACFACYDGKDYQAAIWKTLRPARAVSYKEVKPEVE